MSRLPARTAVGASALLLGSLIAVPALLVHRLGGGDRPWGLVLAVLASAAGSVGLRCAGAGATGAIGYALGWGAVVVTALGGRPEGDFLVAGDALGWSFLAGAGGAVVVSTALAVAGSGHRDQGHRP